MKSMRNSYLRTGFFLVVISIFAATNVFTQGKKALTIVDMMKFKEIHNAAISGDGKWIAYTAQPDRGDGEVKIQSTTNEIIYTIDRGSRPVISSDSRWIGAFVLPNAVDVEKAKQDKPKQGMALLNTETNNTRQWEKIAQFSFSNDAHWLVLHHYKEELKKNSKKAEEKQQESKESETEEKKQKKNFGSDLVLIDLNSSEEKTFYYVTSFAFDSTSKYLAFTVADTSGADNGIYGVELKSEMPEFTIETQNDGYYSSLAWNNRSGNLAYLSSVLDNNENPGPAALKIWQAKTKDVKTAIKTEEPADGWIIYAKNELTWTNDGKRLFFGLKPESEIIHDEKEEKSEDKEIDLYDINEILDKKELDVWHWNDPLINPQQKKMWPRVKDRTYRAVYFADSDKFIPLADQNMPNVQISQNPRFALGESDVPYLKLITWDGWYNDYYIVNLKDGSRKLITAKLGDRAALSPNGNYVVYYNDKNWYVYDVKKKKTSNLTNNIDVPFYNEDHDYPEAVPGYGIGGWVEDDAAVLIYDKYDIWQFPLKTGSPMNLTDGIGRKQKYIFRIQNLDPEKQSFQKNETLFLTAYHDLKKYTAFYSVQVSHKSVKKLIEEDKKFHFLAKAKHADRIIFTRESYTEFPDIWISDLSLHSPKKLTNVNPQVKDFAWGSAELVEWNSLDGIPLQGVLIKPGNYERGKHYPVLVYFYRFFSQRLYEFNQVVVNHRPCFPFYASNGYAIFLPDIRFEIGRPGFAATKCLVPGVQKIIDMGIADPKAIGLHGHSWSGYQTAFMVTQTDIFACAIAGAPVSNMTSAYSGIRWGSGLARQFQYEKSQSRIGGSLWECLDQYIENSPVFFADRIHTPLLIMHGDEDDAVPWYQSIELYLAMRRLGKNCIFLEYRGEPHHPHKYPNKLDYTIRMKEYLDHYLKGAPAADWITKGITYQGK